MEIEENEAFFQLKAPQDSATRGLPIKNKRVKLAFNNLNW